MQSNTSKTVNVRDLSLNENNSYKEYVFSISVFHLPEDPTNANRIRVANQDIEIELLPSKGLSVYQVWIKGKPIFWEAPIGLPDTETLDLWSDEIKINGHAAPGFTFLKTLMAGVELYGLRNWGMPTEIDGKLQPLHGETSNIPVDEVLFSIENENICNVESSFIYRTFEGDNHLPWYERGEAIFKVTRKLILLKDALEFSFEDTIENISNMPQIPDWGYHITFRPEEGAKYIVPSQKAGLRGGNPLPADIQTWHKAKDESVRTETGILHKNIKVGDNGLVTSHLVYPDGSGIKVSTTPSPYFQTWFCNGGKDSMEFTDSNNQSILEKNWDGIGIEFGSSSLDHDHNTDQSVPPEPVLNPGETRRITICFDAASPGSL